MARTIFMASVDGTSRDPRDEPIEWENVFISPPANGLDVEEIEYDEYLIALEEWRKKNKQAEE